MRFPLIAIIVLSLAFVAGCDQKSGSGGTAVVNFTRLVEESQAGLDAQKHIETVASAMQEPLMAAQNTADMAALQVAYSMYQEAVGVLQQDVLTAFNEAVRVSAEKLRVERGFDCVLTEEMAITYGPEADITDAVIAEMNKTAVEYPTPDFDLTPLLSMFPAQQGGEGAEGAEAPEAAE